MKTNRQVHGISGASGRSIGRRDFLRKGALGVGGLLAGPSLFSGCAKKGAKIKNWAWLTERRHPTVDDWRVIFAKMKQHGVDGALALAKPEMIEKLVPVAKETGIELHNWIIALRCTDEEVRKNHPEWFQVNRLGQSSLEKPPYIPSYTWLCPSREEVIQYLESKVSSLSDIDGLVGVHLDYIRYPDVILPVGIQPRYNLVQDKEYPQYDFCYCEVCRELFKKQEGIDPLELDDPSQSEAWRQFRYNRVTNLVNRLVKVAHGKGKMLTAAVFPSPEIARKLVRQDWPSWNLDAFHPMMYHKYHNADIPWIGKVTSEGVQVLGGRAELYSGLFVGWLPPADLDQAVRVAMANGANGVTLFTATRMTDEQWQQLKKTCDELG